MKNSCVITAVLFLFHAMPAQEKVKHFELGPTLLTVNSFNKNYYSNMASPALEFSNGLFFRYTHNRVGLRATVSYNESHFKYYAPVGCVDCTNGETSNKDFKIGMGVQYTLLKRKDWLYGFADISYRNVFSKGFIYGGIAGLNNSFSASTNGLDGLIGLGIKCRLFEDIFLMPEVGYTIFYGGVNYSTTHLLLGQSSRSHYLQGSINPIGKLHLTVRF